MSSGPNLTSVIQFCDFHSVAKFVFKVLRDCFITVTDVSIILYNKVTVPSCGSLKFRNRCIAQFGHLIAKAIQEIKYQWNQSFFFCWQNSPVQFTCRTGTSFLWCETLCNHHLENIKPFVNLQTFCRINHGLRQMVVVNILKNVVAYGKWHVKLLLIPIGIANIWQPYIVRTSDQWL